MATIEKMVRSSLGITQQQMAILLGITRSSYAMIENRQRALPTKAMPKFFELCELLEHQFEVIPTPQVPSFKVGDAEKQLSNLADRLLKSARKYKKYGAVLKKKQNQQLSLQKALPATAHIKLNKVQEKLSTLLLDDAKAKRKQNTPDVSNRFERAAAILEQAYYDLQRLNAPG